MSMEWLAPALALLALAPRPGGGQGIDDESAGPPFPTTDSILTSPQWAKRWQALTSKDPLAWVDVKEGHYCVIMTPSRYVAMHVGGKVTAGVVQHAVKVQKFETTRLFGFTEAQDLEYSKQKELWWTFLAGTKSWDTSNSMFQLPVVIIELRRLQIWPKCDIEDTLADLAPYPWWQKTFKPAWSATTGLKFWPSKLRLELWQNGILGPAVHGVVRRGVYLRWITVGWWPEALAPGQTKAFRYWLKSLKNNKGHLVQWDKFSDVSPAQRIIYLQAAGWSLPKNYLLNAGKLLKEAANETGMLK